MKPRKTWILIADGARARIVENAGPGSGLKAALGHEFAASHAKSRDIVTDKPGRGHESVGGAHHAVEPRVDWHEYGKTLFAKSMADELAKAEAGGAFDALILAAPPKTLGALRKALPGKVQDKIQGELDKDLTHVSIHELPGHLEGLIAL